MSDLITELKNELEKQNAKAEVSPGPLQWLRNVNTFLEGIPSTITSFFNTIFKSGENLSQKAVDMICEWGAWVVNYSIEKQRQKVVKSLYEQYGIMFKVQQSIMIVKQMVSNPLSALGSVASAVKNILNFFIGPIAFVVSYMIEIFKELARLADNMAKIAQTVPPSSPSPNINCDKFRIKIGKMGAAILTEDPSSMPTPREVFPEPIKPFSAEYWEALSGEVKQVYRDEKPFYSMKESVKKVKEYNEQTKEALEELKQLSGSTDN